MGYIAHQAPLSMGILQARILEWVALPSSRGSSWPRDQTNVSCISCIAGRLLYCRTTGEAIRVTLVKIKWQSSSGVHEIFLWSTDESVVEGTLSSEDPRSSRKNLEHYKKDSEAISADSEETERNTQKNVILPGSPSLEEVSTKSKSRSVE